MASSQSGYQRWLGITLDSIGSMLGYIVLAACGSFLIVNHLESVFHFGIAFIEIVDLCIQTSLSFIYEMAYLLPSCVCLTILIYLFCIWETCMLV